MNWMKSRNSIRNSEIIHIGNDNDHYLSVHECDLAGNFSVHYCLDGSLRINKFITAVDMAEAKHKAMLMMREYIRKNAQYWNAIEAMVDAEINSMRAR